MVNTFGSLAQSVFVFCLLPLLAALRGLTLQELPNYLAQGESSCRGPCCQLW